MCERDLQSYQAAPNVGWGLMFMKIDIFKVVFICYNQWDFRAIYFLHWLSSSILGLNQIWKSCLYLESNIFVNSVIYCLSVASIWQSDFIRRLFIIKIEASLKYFPYKCCCWKTEWLLILSHIANKRDTHTYFHIWYVQIYEVLLRE